MPTRSLSLHGSPHLAEAISPKFSFPLPVSFIPFLHHCSGLPSTIHEHPFFQNQLSVGITPSKNSVLADASPIIHYSCALNILYETIIFPLLIAPSLLIWAVLHVNALSSDVNFSETKVKPPFSLHPPGILQAHIAVLVCRGAGQALTQIGDPKPLGYPL